MYVAQDASCVLVGREYGSRTLIVFNIETASSPVIIDDPGNYTFSIFGKNATHIDANPSFTERVLITVSHDDTRGVYYNNPTILLCQHCHTMYIDGSSSYTSLVALATVPVVMVFGVVAFALVLVRKEVYEKLL